MLCNLPRNCPYSIHCRSVRPRLHRFPATVKRIQEYSVAAHGMPRFAGPCAHGCHHVGETLRAQILTPCMLEATPHSLQARGRLESDGKPRQGATTTRLITGR